MRSLLDLCGTLRRSLYLLEDTAEMFYVKKQKKKRVTLHVAVVLTALIS